MATTRSSLLPVRILKVWFDIVLVTGAIGLAIFVVWLAISPIVMAERGAPVDAKILVVIGQRSILPVLPVAFQPRDPTRDPQIVKAALTGTHGELRIETTSWWLQFTSLGAIFIGLVVVLYAVWILRRVLVNVLDDRPFDAVNGRLLRRCGFIILAMGVAFPPIEFLLSQSVLSRIQVTTIELSPAITIDKDVFVVGLLFLVFGAVLTRGHEIQEHEQSLAEEQAFTI